VRILNIMITLCLAIVISFAGSAEANDTDVIVVGAGMSGMVAAIEAADYGADVVLFEKTSRLGGTAVVAGGSISGANALMQYEAGITDDSAELFYADIYRLGRGEHDPELAWKHVEEAGLAVDYMDKMGVDFGDREPGNTAYDPFDVDRQYMAADGGAGYTSVLEEEVAARVERGHIDLRMQTKVTGLIQDECGGVVGVNVEDVESGDTAEYASGAVILATGGYAANLDLVKRYNFDNARTAALPHATGDGFEMAEEIGAGFANMDYLPAYPGSIPLPESPERHELSAEVEDYPGAIWVDKYGRRMSSEHDLTTGERQAVWAEAPANKVFIILDEGIRSDNASIIAGHDWERFEELLDDGVVKSADTVEELAEALGVDVSGLHDTVDAYNQFVEQGEDEDFDRSELEYKLENPPFYGIKTYPFVLLTKGGPTMNTNAQILDEHGRVIPGVYQTGELVGGANIGGQGSVGGLAHTINVVWSRISGQHAAAYAQQNR